MGFINGDVGDRIYVRLVGRQEIRQVVAEVHGVAARVEEGHVPESSEMSVGSTAEMAAPTKLSIDDYLPPSRLSRIPFPRDADAAELHFKEFEGVVGDAEIMVLISSEGDVDDVVLLESTLPKPLVERAIAHFKAEKFVPGGQGSMNVRSRVRIRLTPPTADQLMGNPASAREKAWRR
ncbi:MAG: hypothetical protein D3M94_08800 [Rhodocyclales bacterium GT-UBC]|nr:MAG: hypothetical protein D3M94_08800 [Rhodocyclales bacterium GT-UBC]